MTKCQLRAQHAANLFISNISFHAYNHYVRLILLLFPFYRCGNRSSEKFSDRARAPAWSLQHQMSVCLICCLSCPGDWGAQSPSLRVTCLTDPQTRPVSETQTCIRNPDLYPKPNCKQWVPIKRPKSKGSGSPPGMIFVSQIW